MYDHSTRRDVLMATAAAGVGMVAAPALAQSGARPTADPTTRYTSTPFPEQKQKWPALQRDMTPVPDCGETSCGETSYRGSGRLQGRKASCASGSSVGK